MIAFLRRTPWVVALLACTAAWAQVVDAELLLEPAEIGQVAIQQAVVLGDVDGNGFDDWAVSGGFQDPGWVRIVFWDADGVDRTTLLASGQGGLLASGLLDNFGSSLAPLGDFNNDGVPDLLATSEHAWLLLLSADGTVQELHFNWDASRAAPIGDVFQNGQTALALGAPDEVAGWGRTAIQPLTPSGSNAGPPTDLIPEQSGGFAASPFVCEFGRGLVGPGDLNGDGQPDLLAGAEAALWWLYLDNTGQVISERSFSPSSTSTIRSFGENVALPGDVDGDGIDDIAVSDRFTSAFWVLYMQIDDTVRYAQKISAGSLGVPGSTWRFGTGFSAAGDLNGDGVGDLLACPDVGGVYAVYLGCSGPDCDRDGIPDECEPDCNRNGVPDDCDLDRSDPDGDGQSSWDCNTNGIPDECDGSLEDRDGDHRWYSDCDGDGRLDVCEPSWPDTCVVGRTTRFGPYGDQVAAIDDVNADGRPDLVFGNFNGRIGYDRTGRVQTVALDAEGQVASLGPVLSAGEWYGAGRAVCTLGEYGGATWIAFGCQTDFENVDVALVPIDDQGAPLAPAIRLGVPSSDYGASIGLAPAGDVNGDGVPDLLRGSPTTPDDFMAIGSFEIIELGADMQVLQRREITSNHPVLACEPSYQARFGGALSSIGDLDGDGIAELAVGAPNQRPFGRGAVWILFLNQLLDLRAARGILPDHPFLDPPLRYQGGLGTSLTPIGDLDGDGISELAVGANATSDSGQGEVRLLWLNADGQLRGQRLIEAPDGINQGPHPEFGTSIAALGDRDGDGAIEIAVTGSRSRQAWLLNLHPGPDTNGDGIGDFYQADCNGNQLADAAELDAGAAIDCDGNGIPDACDLAAGYHQDCNNNGILDICDIATGSLDTLPLGGDGVPDLCQTDCNGDGSPDAQQIEQGDLSDCNGNGVADVCDLTSGTSVDRDGDSVPDDCIVSHIREYGYKTPNIDASEHFGTEFGLACDWLTDLNGDGYSEIVVHGHGDFGGFWILFPDANGEITDYAVHASEDFGLDYQADTAHALCDVGDLNGDGRSELAFGAPGLGNGAVFILFLEVDGSLQSYVEISEQQGGLPGVLPTDARFGDALASVGDLDQDGIAELAVGADDGLRVMFLNPTGSVRTWMYSPVGVGKLSSMPDFDGDQIPDLVAADSSIEILLLNLDGSVREQVSVPAFSNRALLGIDDADGNGYPDLISTTGFSQPDLEVLLLESDGGIRSTISLRDRPPHGLPLNQRFGASLAIETTANGTELLVGATHTLVHEREVGSLYRMRLHVKICDGCDARTCATSTDCNGNGIEDWCETDPNQTNIDCDGDRVPDDCQLADGTYNDCDMNGVPDACQIADDPSADSAPPGGNGILDSCEADCNGNLIPDADELTSETDCDGDGQLDECAIAAGLAFDCTLDGVPDHCQIHGPIPGAALRYQDPEDVTFVSPSRRWLVNAPLTLEALVYPLDVSGTHTVVSRNAARRQNFFLKIEQGHVLFGYRDVSQTKTFTYRSTSPVVDPEIWTHIAVVHVFGQEQISLFVDGTERPGTWLDPPTAGPSKWMGRLRFGAERRATDDGVRHPFVGAIDEVRLFEALRTQEEIQSSAFTQLDPGTPGLEMYFRFDEGSGQFTHSLTGFWTGQRSGSTWTETPSCVVCPGDATGDMALSLDDLAIVLSQFGEVGDGLPGDVTQDGIIDLNDLALLLQFFGTDCTRGAPQP